MIRVSEHPLTIRALGILGIDLGELCAIERRPPNAEACLDAFKAKVKSGFKSAVLKHHPDKGGNPETFILLRKFCEWVEGWTIRPKPIGPVSAQRQTRQKQRREVIQFVDLVTGSRGDLFEAMRLVLERLERDEESERQREEFEWQRQESERLGRIGRRQQKAWPYEIYSTLDRNGRTIIRVRRRRSL